MPNYRALAYKLQRALIGKGRKVTINQYQVYNDKQDRMVTKYLLKENGKTIMEDWQIINVVKRLASELDGGGS